MTSLALPVLRTTRQPLLRRAAALVTSSPIFSLSSARAAPAAFLPSAAIASNSTTTSISLSTSSAAPSLASLIPDTLAGLRDLLPGWVLAVPKSKTTHSAKRMRSANKGLKEKQNLVSCPSCGAPKLAHHLCHNCHTAFRREIHREAKELKHQTPRP